ncbi:MAG: GNAT family N-acetyltransferase [Pseudomonadaceae bacterium]|nr:GNAT family N-acetyltransferase [Pseudomonadaceae bacterium]
MPITTPRLRLRKPVTADAQAIFDQYASHPAVTRYLSWPTHTSLEDTIAFIEFSDAEWARSGTGPHLVETLHNDQLIGGTGLSMETDYRASTGYVFAQSAWGQGYASEALAAMNDLADKMGVYRLEAITHVQHAASAHVLLKGGFQQEGLLRGHTRFPNLEDSTPQDICMFGRTANNAA